MFGEGRGQRANNLLVKHVLISDLLDRARGTLGRGGRRSLTCLFWEAGEGATSTVRQGGGGGRYLALESNLYPGRTALREGSHHLDRMGTAVKYLTAYSTCLPPTHISIVGKKFSDRFLTRPPVFGPLPDDIVWGRMDGPLSLGTPHLTRDTSHDIT